MTDHIAEGKLEQLLLFPDEVPSEERESIELHLTECALCRENWKRMEEFNKDLARELEGGPTERDRAMAERLLSRRKRLANRLLALPGRTDRALDRYVETLEVYEEPRTTRLIRYARSHPVRVAAAVSFAALVTVFSLLVSRTPKDTNPTSARVKDGVLSVVNKEGEVLWTKDATGMWDVISGLAFPKRYAARSLSVVDIDGDGIREVLLFGSGPDGIFSDDTLRCFEHDGHLRWTTGGGDVITFGTMKFTKEIRWSVRDLFTLDEPRNGRTRTFVIAQATPYWPGKVFEVDPGTGSHLQEYWHAGGLSMGIAVDIDSDGQQEIVAGGINNAHEAACITILDPLRIAGHGPALAEYVPEGIPRAREKHYLLLPRTDMNRALAKAAYNDIERMVSTGSGSLLVHTAETTDDKEYPGGVIYTFGPDMEVKSAIGSDSFTLSHERLEKEGRLTQKLTPEYWEELKEGVRYWDGESSRFVSYNELRKSEGVQ